MPYIMNSLAAGIVAGTTTYLLTQSFYHAILVTIFASVTTAILVFGLAMIVGRLEHKQYEKELLIFSQEAEKQGWELDELLPLKNNVRAYLIDNPGTTTQELLKRYGDKTNPHLQEPEFTQTLTHLGYYSIDRFGQDETGKWFSIHDSKTVYKNYKLYQKEILEAYNKKGLANV